jgi:hypothetical protein
VSFKLLDGSEVGLMYIFLDEEGVFAAFYLGLE